ncbi:MAG TPA: hypothetical protein VI565_00985, partial [Burkholderiales bacterium]|nr:hypothetical protein [Burkholderiales bacterium]
MKRDSIIKDSPGDCRHERRGTLKLLLVAGLCGPWKIAGAASSRPMLTRAIPSTGEKLPVIGLGTSDEFSVSPGE